MIKIYAMETCPDCTFIKEQVKGNDKYEVIDIGAQARNLKEFLQLRDSNPAFDRVKEKGTIGIPCFILEDGTVTFRPAEAGLERRPRTEPVAGAACNLDGSGC